VAEVFRAALQQGCPSTRVCEPAGYSVQDSAALWRTASGRPLRSLLERRSDRRERAVHVVQGLGTALRVLHAIPAGAGAFQQVDGTAPPDGHDEAAATLRAGEHVAALLPEVGRTYTALLSDLVDALARLPTEPVTLNHGDFKSDNLLVDGARSWILDLDRSGWADPALDLGKFLADVRWWCRDGDAEPLCSAFRHGYGAADPARWARADLLAGLFRLKFAARRVPVHGVGWPVEVRRRVGDVARSMREARAS
jgi:aminoglycoside phosphotransferase (APT) family kinase protein